jgi:hypothetical protein
MTPFIHKERQGRRFHFTGFDSSIFIRFLLYDLSRFDNFVGRHGHGCFDQHFVFLHLRYVLICIVLAIIIVLAKTS